MLLSMSIEGQINDIVLACKTPLLIITCLLITIHINPMRQNEIASDGSHHL